MQLPDQFSWQAPPAISAMKRLPLALSSINNTLGSPLDTHDPRCETSKQLWAEDEVRQGKKRSLPQQALQEPASSLSKQAYHSHAHAAGSVSQYMPHSRKMLASPRTAQMVAAKAQEVAKKLPRSWENPQPAQRPQTPQPGRVPKVVMRNSRSEACSPRANAAELWNEDLTPRQMHIRQKVTC